MPTLSAAALHTLIQAPGSQKMNNNISSPCLYATPDSTTLLLLVPPDPPSSFPPSSSAFVINHKRRGPRLLLPQQQQPHSDPQNDDDHQPSESTRIEAKEEEQEEETDADFFFDVHDSLSTITSSSNDGDDDNRSKQLQQPQLLEYYDALEEISSDGVAHSYPNIKDELSEVRVNWLMEIERRKQAEDALQALHNKWKMLSQHLSSVGLRLAVPPMVLDEADKQSKSDPVKELCQQIVVTRCVADAVGRACSRAEVEMEMEPVIESKNFEIARLLDRLHYYETANKEMCERNQETVGMARKLRIRRKRRQKWFWSSIGTIVTLGAAAIAWSYIVPDSASGPSYEDTTKILEN